VILTRGGERLTFGEDRAAPGLNLLGLAQRGLFRLREVAKKPVRTEMEQFLRYDPVQTFAALDAVPFSELARRAQLPPRLQAVFTAFGRAFFAAPEELSTAELIKSFHFYYLSHDLGLVYDHVSGGTMSRLLDGLRAHLQAHGAEVLLGAAVERIDRADGHLSVAGQAFDHVVLAADVSAARGVVDRSPWIGQADPALAERLQALHAGRRYAVWRIWIDARAGDDLPAFVSTERLGELDAIAFVDRLDPECGQWASAHGGAVLELHAYALTDQAKTPDDVRRALLAELFQHLPALRQATVVHQHLQLRDDFTAFHLGQHGHRPPVATAVGGLVLAGDWVALPMPAMLMEAAHTAGRLAANVILSAEGLRETPVASVPLRGVLLGPQR